LGGWTVAPEVIYAVTVGCAIVGAGLFVRAARGVGENERSDEAEGAGDGFREALRFSIPSYLGNLVQVANYRLDLFILAFFAGVGKVGLYALAVVIAQVVWLAPQAVSLVLLPGTAAESDHARNSDRAAQGARIALWGSAAACLALAIVAWWAIPLVFGSAFAGSRTLLLVLLPGVWLLAPATVLASFIVGVGKPRANLMVASVAFAVTLVLDLALIPTWGATGAALASTASYSVSALLTVWVFLRLSTAAVGDVLIPRHGDLRDVVRAGRSAIARREIAR
jgi:O-antigen/teichoic acid export membrane protein